MDGTIAYCSEDTDFQIKDGELVTEWLTMIAGKHGFGIRVVTFIFCSDRFLLGKNKNLLGHDDLTDVISIPFHEPDQDFLVGDVFVSVDRVKDNSKTLKNNFVDELHRVMVHGLLHLCGFTDSDQKTKNGMRNAEDLALNLRMF